MHLQYAPRPLPDSLSDLMALALNMRWSWYHGTDHLWEYVDRELWSATNRNPWLMLREISEQRLLELSRDQEFLAKLAEHVEAYQRYMNAETWFEQVYDGGFKGTIAYFSMEFGVSESLPIYSGGLGILAGDYLKTASDLGIPLVGVGLLYQRGYFRQAISPDGEQLEFFPYNDPTMLPIAPLRADDDSWIHIEIELPGRSLRLRTWLASAGRRTLLLLDSNDPLNDPGDRGITSELYGGGTDMRIRQEMVLGIGGWRLLEKLGLDCCVCHLNEGHAAFAILERARFFMEEHRCDFAEALWATRAGNLFTTHTPVDAGFDRFPTSIVSAYLKRYTEQLGLPMAQLLQMGRAGTAADEPFNMAYLAMHGSGAVNGVSRLHSVVSQHIFQPLYPRWPQSEVPVGHVTNGVHVPSWDSVAADRLWTNVCGKACWQGALEGMAEHIGHADDESLWHMRAENRRVLVEFVRSHFERYHGGVGRALQSAELSNLLDSTALTIGFARRFTEYKRPNILLTDRARLMRLLTDRDRPVQLVIAGKAHPQDRIGRGLLKEWHDFLAQPELKGRAIFIEDHDILVGANLVRGVDVWINTPRRPWEACGTSGMKILVNGGLNLSELDGWWDEAYVPEAGWAIGNGAALSDADEAQQLYRVLEEDVVPSFYRRDEHGLPRDWIARMRESMTRYTVQFSSNRMAREYMDSYYAPLAAKYQMRSGEGVARELANWQRQLVQHWQRIHFGNVDWRPCDGGWHCSTQVYLGEIAATDVRVEIYADPEPHGEPCRVALSSRETLPDANNAFAFEGEVISGRPLSDFTLRIVPMRAGVQVPLESNLVLWYR